MRYIGMILFFPVGLIGMGLDKIEELAQLIVYTYGKLIYDPWGKFLRKTFKIKTSY